MGPEEIGDMSDTLSLLYSYVALFAWSFLAVTVIPMSSEPPLISEHGHAEHVQQV